MLKRTDAGAALSYLDYRKLQFRTHRTSAYPYHRVAMPEGRETAQILREQAARCRRLARAMTDREVSRRLLELAKEFEERAAAVEAASRCLT